MTLELCIARVIYNIVYSLHVKEVTIEEYFISALKIEQRIFTTFSDGLIIKKIQF